MMLLELDATTAGHAAAAMARYRRWAVEQRILPLGPGFDALLAAMNRAARPADPLSGSGQHLTLDEVADVCAVSRRTVQRRVAGGELTPTRDGRRVLFERAEVARYLATRARR